MIVNNEREAEIYKQGYMSGSNAAQTAIKAAEHRAEIAERALLDMCRETAAFPSYMVACAIMERLLKKAEKELAEERENAESRRKDN